MKKFGFIKNTMMASAIAISTLASPLAALTDEEIEAAVQNTFYNASEAAGAIRRFTTDQWNMLKGHLEGYHYGNVAIPGTDVRIHAAQIAAGLDSKYWSALFWRFYTTTPYDLPQYITGGKLQSWIPGILSTLEEKDWDTFFGYLHSPYQTDHSETFKFMFGKKIPFENWIDYMSAADGLLRSSDSTEEITSSEKLPIIRGLLGDEIDASPLIKRGIAAFQKENLGHWSAMDARIRDIFSDFEVRLSLKANWLRIDVEKRELKLAAYIALVEKFSGTMERTDLEPDFVEDEEGRYWLNSSKFKPDVDAMVEDLRDRDRGLVSRPSASAETEE